MQQSRAFEYPHKSIGSLRALASHLGMSEQQLRWAVENAGPSAYFIRKHEPSRDRRLPDKVTYEARDWLKSLQERLLDRLFREVRYPPYVVGGVPGRDLRAAVERHLHARSLMTFDVSRFYESTSVQQVHRILKRFFCFPDEVAIALCKLTTLHGRLPRGASTSSYLANLVFFADEEGLVDKLASWKPFPLRYSRWVDDIAITSQSPLSDETVAEVTGLVASMVMRHGLRFTREKNVKQPKRRKRRVVRSALVVTIHNIQIRGARMSVTGDKRNELRRSVFYLDQMAEKGPLSSEDLKRLRSAQSRLGYIGQFHPRLAAQYRPVLRSVWRRHKASGGSRDESNAQGRQRLGRA